MDYEFYLKTSMRYGVSYIPHVLATYRMHPHSKSLTKNEAWPREICAVAEAHWPATMPKPDFEAARKICLAKVCGDEMCLREFMQARFRSAWSAFKQAYAYSPRKAVVTVAAPQRVARYLWQSRL